MTEVTAAFALLTTLFGVYTTLKIATTGFGVGVKWMRRA